jgi:hypothetical protein
MERTLRKYIRQVLLREFAPMPIDGDYTLEKNKPHVIDYDDPQRQAVGDDIFKMTFNSYADLGGHFKVMQRDDIEKNYGAAKDGQWLVMDVDDDPQVDVALMGKQDPGIPGIALGSAATDGSKAAKDRMKDLMNDKISDGKWWGSASGKIGVSLIRRGTPSLVHEEDIQFFEPDIHKYYGDYPLPVGAKDDSGMTIGATHPFRARHGWFSRVYGDGKEHFKLVFTGFTGAEKEVTKSV